MEQYEIANHMVGTKENVLENLGIALQRTEQGTPDMMTQTTGFDGISGCLVIHYSDDETGIDAVIRHGVGNILDRYEISKADAWKRAHENVNADTHIVGLTEALTGERPKEETLYAITNSTKSYGASCVLNDEAIKRFASAHNTHRIAVLPSSIHEMLLVPHPESIGDIDRLSDVVAQVNATEVEPEERLTDRAYEVYI